MLAAAAATASGCSTYQSQPLNAGAMHAAWLARTPSDEPARDFARRLAEAEGWTDEVVFDSSDGLTLREAEPVALVFNRELRLARLEAGVARATAEHAGLWEDPVVGVDIERILSGVDDPWVVGGAIGFTIPISGSTSVAKDQADATYAAELARLAAREWATRIALRTLWIEWSAQTERVRLAHALTDRLRDIVALVERQEGAGVLSRVDARLFAVELAAAEADLIASEAGEVELRLRVLDMLGLSPEAPVVLIPAIASSASQREWTLAQIEAGNADLAVAAAEYAAAEQSLRLEIRKQYPDLVIGPGFATDQGDERVLLGLELPLPLWNRNRQGVAAAHAERDVARARYESTLEHLASRLAIARSRHEADRAMRQAVEGRVLPLVDEQDAEVQRIAELGRLNALLLLEALHTQSRAKGSLLDAREAEAIGVIRLEELVGPPRKLASNSDQSTPRGDAGQSGGRP